MQLVKQWIVILVTLQNEVFSAKSFQRGNLINDRVNHQISNTLTQTERNLKAGRKIPSFNETQKYWKSKSKKLATKLKNDRILKLLDYGKIFQPYNRLQYHGFVDRIEDLQSYSYSQSELNDPQVPNSFRFRNEYLESLVERLQGDAMLPSDLNSLRYRIKIHPFHWGNCSFFGEVDFEFEVLNDTDFIVLHSVDLEIDEESVRLDRILKNSSTRVAINNRPIRIPSAEMILFSADELLQKGNKYTLSMQFSGNLSDVEFGLYRLPYKIHNETRWIVSSQLQTVFARHVFPCLDEPKYKAKFEVWIARPRNSSSLSNMKLKKTIEFPGQLDMAWDQFSTSPLIPTYIVAFVVTDFKATTLQGPGITYSIWHRPDMEDDFSYILHTIARITKLFASHFQVDYPLDKLDVLALPTDTSRAMENMGLVSMGERTLLVTHSSNFEEKYSSVKLLAHELAHMWFGNLVSPVWWNDVWISEGFASYFEILALRVTMADQYFEHSYAGLNQPAAFRHDVVPFAKPLQMKLKPQETMIVFNEITYSKGPAIIYMMDHILPRGYLRRIVSKYLNKRKYSSTTNKALLTDFDAILSNMSPFFGSSVRLSDTFHQWLTHTGHPLVTFTVSGDGGTVTVTQERFGYSPLKATQTNPIWPIPLTFATKSTLNFNPRNTTWLTEASTTIRLNERLTDGGWLVGNVQRVGYYRVNYDSRNWERIADALKENHKILPIANRIQILDDALHLYYADLLSKSLVLSLFSYLEKEEELIVWVSVFNNVMTSFHNRDIHPDHYLLYKDEMSEVVVKAFSKSPYSELL